MQVVTVRDTLKSSIGMKCAIFRPETLLVSAHGIVTDQTQRDVKRICSQHLCVTSREVLATVISHRSQIFTIGHINTIVLVIPSHALVDKTSTKVFKSRHAEISAAIRHHLQSDHATTNNFCVSCRAFFLEAHSYPRNGSCFSAKYCLATARPYKDRSCLL